MCVCVGVWKKLCGGVQRSKQAMQETHLCTFVIREKLIEMLSFQKINQINFVQRYKRKYVITT